MVQSGEKLFILGVILLLNLVIFQIAVGAPSGGQDVGEKVEDAIEDIKEYANDHWDEIWSGRCISDDDCNSWMSYCHDQDDLLGIGECRMHWWIILIFAVLALLLISSIVSCLCCPCCCLYNMCMSCLDCLFCGCCKRCGYHRANSS